MDALKIYLNWGGYWLWLAVLVAGQTLLLLLPINLAEHRLPAHRPVKVPVIVTGLFLANLFVAGLATLLCTAFKENGGIQGGGLEFFQRLNLFPTSRADSDGRPIGGMLTTLVFFWGSGLSFSATSQNPTTLTRCSSAAHAGCCAAAFLNSSSPCPAIFSCAAAATAARPSARTGALPPAFPSCSSASVGACSSDSRTVRAVETKTAEQKLEREIPSQRLTEAGRKPCNWGVTSDADFCNLTGNLIPHISHE